MTSTNNLQPTLIIKGSNPPSLSDAEDYFEFSPEYEETTEYDHVDRPSNVSKLSSDSFRSTASSTSSGGNFTRNSNGRQSFNQRNTWLRSSLRRSSGSTPSTKRLSANGHASQMFRSPSTASPNSRRSSLSCDSDEMGNDQICLEDDVLDLTQKIASLQEQVSALNDSQTTNDDRYTKVKQENAVLLAKIHELEEQLREIEIRSDDRQREEEKRFKNAMARHERDKSFECEQYINRIYCIQQELLEAKEDVRKYQNLVEKMKNEKNSLEEQFQEKVMELDMMGEELIKLKELTWRHRDEDHANRRVIEALNLEMDELRKTHNGENYKSRNMSNESSDIRMLNEFDAELRSMREENRGLREANEELQAQILNSHLEKGRSLIKEGEAASSLASEISNLTVDSLRTALREQQDVNAKLRTYIDNILLNIVENYPQLLEVKAGMLK